MENNVHVVISFYVVETHNTFWRWRLGVGREGEKEEQEKEKGRRRRRRRRRKRNDIDESISDRDGLGMESGKDREVRSPGRYLVPSRATDHLLDVNILPT